MACRYRLRADGTRQILAYLVPGDFCNIDIGLVERRDHAIGSLSACRFARMDFAPLGDLVAQQAPVIKTLRQANLVDEATLREWLVNLGSRSAIERIAHLFLELLMRLRAIGLARGRRLRSSRLAARPRGYDRSLDRARQPHAPGLEAPGPDRAALPHLMIRNVQRLTTLAGFDPRYLALDSATFR